MMSKSEKHGLSLKPSENAYKITLASTHTREQTIERNVRALLNKICPKNRTTIIERFASIHIERASELEFLITIMFQQALHDSHHYEICRYQDTSDMLYALRSRCPDFPPEQEGEK